MGREVYRCSQTAGDRHPLFLSVHTLRTLSLGPEGRFRCPPPLAVAGPQTLGRVLQGVIEDDGYEDGLLLVAALAARVPGQPREPSPPTSTKTATRTCVKTWLRVLTPLGTPRASRVLGDAV